MSSRAAADGTSAPRIVFARLPSSTPRQAIGKSKNTELVAARRTSIDAATNGIDPNGRARVLTRRIFGDRGRPPSQVTINLIYCRNNRSRYTHPVTVKDHALFSLVPEMGIWYNGSQGVGPWDAG